MSTQAPEPAPDGIDEGRRLIRLGGDAALSLADRLAERFHRLTWRTPIHSIRLKGRYPLKLIAVPDDPVMGDVARGHALLEGVLGFRGETRDIETLDLAKPDWGKPFAEHLHSFAWLRDLSTVATRARGAPIAEHLMSLWLATHADTVGGLAWRPDLWGRRILFWTCHAPLILSSADLIYRSKVLNALARGARHLDRGADKAAAGAPRIAAWCGVVAAGLLIPGGEPRQAFCEAGLLRALGTGLFDDGGSVSRSPVMLLDCIQLLTMLQETYAARRMELPEPVAATLTRMVAALLGVMHGDRALSSWQGGGPLAETEVAAVIEASGVRTRPLRQARDWGYQRLAAGTAVLVVDAAPPPVARLVEGGCASTLAFEFSDGAARIVVNCGGARAGVAQLPAALAEGLRSTAAHSTLTLSETSSSRIAKSKLAGPILLPGVSDVTIDRRDDAHGNDWLRATHDGYLKEFGYLYHREIGLNTTGNKIKGHDRLFVPDGEEPGDERLVAVVRFHIHPAIRLVRRDPESVVMQASDGEKWLFSAPGLDVMIDEDIFFADVSGPRPSQQLAIEFTLPEVTEIRWMLRRAD